MLEDEDDIHHSKYRKKLGSKIIFITKIYLLNVIKQIT